jgi:hypothetical protein
LFHDHIIRLEDINEAMFTDDGRKNTLNRVSKNFAVFAVTALVVLGIGLVILLGNLYRLYGFSPFKGRVVYVGKIEHDARFEWNGGLYKQAQLQTPEMNRMISRCRAFYLGYVSNYDTTQCVAYSMGNSRDDQYLLIVYHKLMRDFIIYERYARVDV